MSKKGKNNQYKASVTAAYFFIAPALIAIFIFFFIPVIAAFVISFTDFDIYTLGDFNTLTTDNTLACTAVIVSSLNTLL